ncbi:hypothetical protein [Lysobacter sp. GCM10012299]|uniref:hypothetical protein n=1 Tax=Lysobacter sp. GCM10012299 TaxID=3317333 RepID=UPI00360A0110
MAAHTPSNREAKKMATNRRSPPKIAPPQLLPVRPSIPETAEQFLARGGTVERLGTTASSRARRSQRELNDAPWKRKEAMGRKRQSER